ncbi:MAG: GNAT family protein [Thermoanaerobaculia bacterium]|nr:GNAT family protein [Thermoanaerobaculia bacterium]
MSIERIEPDTLETDRLILRSLTESDVTRMTELAGDWDIAARTLSLPHPYDEADAREFLERARERQNSGEGATFGIVERTSGRFIGCCGIELVKIHRCGELGYWIGKPYWNRGFASEAVGRLISWSFSTLGIEKITARVFDGNHASSRVLKKVGMEREGYMKKHLVKWGERRDVEQWGLLAEEWSDGNAVRS